MVCVKKKEEEKESNETNQYHIYSTKSHIQKCFYIYIYYDDASSPFSLIR